MSMKPSGMQKDETSFVKDRRKRYVSFCFGVIFIFKHFMVLYAVMLHIKMHGSEFKRRMKKDVYEKRRRMTFAILVVYLEGTNKYPRWTSRWLQLVPRPLF